MLDALEYINTNKDVLKIEKLVIRGDSALIINFMNKTNIPKKKTLVKKVLEARKLLLQLRGMKCIF